MLTLHSRAPQSCAPFGCQLSGSSFKVSRYLDEIIGTAAGDTSRPNIDKSR